MDFPGEAPHRLGRYHLFRRIGVGGMAEVWLARQDGPAGFHKTLVVKKILPALAENQGFIDMFLEEARLAALLNHRNLVQIFELGREDGAYFLVMEYIHGRNLSQVEDRCNELGLWVPHTFVAQVVAEALDGLHYAHELRGPDGRPLELIHRDVSPDNVLVSFDGQAKVVDLGIARAARQARESTSAGVVRGKFAYMPPEQIKAAPLDRRVDVYAMGVVLYELLAGSRPFPEEHTPALMAAVVNKDPIDVSERRLDVPGPLAGAVRRAMHKDPAQRFPTAAAFADSLRAWLRSEEALGSNEVARFMGKLWAPEEQEAAPTGASPAPIPSIPDSPLARERALRPLPGRSNPAVDALVLPMVTEESQAKTISAKPGILTFLRTRPRWLVGGAIAGGILAVFAVVAFAILAGSRDRLATADLSMAAPDSRTAAKAEVASGKAKDLKSGTGESPDEGDPEDEPVQQVAPSQVAEGGSAAAKRAEPGPPGALPAPAISPELQQKIAAATAPWRTCAVPAKRLLEDPRLPPGVIAVPPPTPSAKAAPASAEPGARADVPRRTMLIIDSVPSGAEVLVDDAPVGVTPLATDWSVTQGSVIKIQKPGFRAWSRTVHPDGQTIRLDARLLRR